MLISFISEISRWAIPLVLLVIPLVAFFRGVKVYEVFVQGAENGFNTAIQIIPYLVGMLVAIGVFRASGAMDLFTQALTPLMELIKAPAEVLPIAIMRPFTGSGTLALAAELIDAHGPNSFIGRLAATMQSSSDTTFFILTVYFGSVGIKKFRHAVIVGLLADTTGMLAAIYISNLVFR